MATLHGPDGVRAWFGDLFRSFPDFAFRVMEIVTEGEKSVVRWHATGTFNGDAKFEGLSPTGATVDIEGMDMVTVIEGHIVENRAYINATEMARQLGAMPPAGSIGERAMLTAVNSAGVPKRLFRRVRS
jgi:predicted ester cyclase